VSYLEADNRSRVRRGVKSCKEQAVMTVLEVNRDHAKLERIHSQRLLDDAYDVNYADVDQTRIPEPPHSIPTRRKKANKTSEESESAPESSKLPARNKSRYRDESDSSDDDSFDWCLSYTASNLGSLKPLRTLSLPSFRPLRYKLKCTGDDDSDESEPDSYTCAFQHSPKSQTKSASEDRGFLELATASLKLPVHVQEDWEKY
jgi:hypothetical protein